VQTKTISSKKIIIISSIGIFIALAIIIFALLKTNITYYYSIQELINNAELQNKKIKISGSVLGDSITTDFSTGEISFYAAHIPVDQNEIENNGGIELLLHNATIDPNTPKIKIIYNGIRPELLVNEAQVIASGSITKDNIFIANELLLKCPSKYEERIEQR
jgi:cytochrome c-type biogenesis protein CcmE